MVIDAVINPKTSLERVSEIPLSKANFWKDSSAPETLNSDGQQQVINDRKTNLCGKFVLTSCHNIRDRKGLSVRKFQ